MGNVWAIGKREFASYFNSPIAYFAITVFMVMMGGLFFWSEAFFETGQATMRPFFEWAPLLFIFLLPAISMRLVAEEKRTGSLEMLITMPIRDVELMGGKLLGAFLFLLVTLTLTAAYPLVISQIGDLDWGPVMGGYLGLALLGLAYLAIGLMTSTWTQNQIVAFILALLICGFFYFLETMAGAFWASARDHVAHFSLKAHFENIAKGVVDTRDILYYLSVTALAVTIGTYSLESRRWT
jgi:ABC-2 type transport system permease protein